MKKRFLLLVCIPVLLLGFVAGCGPGGVRIPNPPPRPPGSPANDPEVDLNLGDSQTEITPVPDDTLPDQSESPSQPTPTPTDGAIQATITMEDGGIIVLELYHDLAPQSVRNFVSLARQGFYDGLKFHRIISGFMIQGGCPQGTGTGGPGYNIKGEFDSNGFSNSLSHKRGILSMARSQAYDSAGSQFFIMHEDSEFLDGEYAAFGRVLSGMDVVDRLAATPNIGGNGEVAPDDMPVIRTITIDSDIELPEPDKL